MRDFDRFSRIKKNKQAESNNVSEVQASTIFPLFTFIQQNFGDFPQFQPHIFIASILLPSWGVLYSHFSTTFKTSCFCRLEMEGEPDALHVDRVKAGWMPCCAPWGAQLGATGQAEVT